MHQPSLRRYLPERAGEGGEQPRILRASGERLVLYRRGEAAEKHDLLDPGRP
jgi:hypothetical protein